MSKLLINESPLQVLPSLATKIGLNEALFIQQVHYWISDKSTYEHDNKIWVYNTYEQWQEQFPFFSIATIKRVLQNLKKKGLLIGKKLSKNKFNKTTYYTIDYEVLEKLEKEIEKETSENRSCNDKNNLTQSNKQMDKSIDKVKLTQSREGQGEQSDKVKLTQSYIVKSKETTTTKINTKTTTPFSPSRKKIGNRLSDEKIEYLDFIKQVRKTYKPIPEKNFFPKIIQIQRHDGIIGYLQVDLSGHLYFKSSQKTENIPSNDAYNYWELIYQNQDRLEPLSNESSLVSN